jgi:hypothetical protein
MKIQTNIEELKSRWRFDYVSHPSHCRESTISQRAKSERDKRADWREIKNPLPLNRQIGIRRVFRGRIRSPSVLLTSMLCAHEFGSVAKRYPVFLL